MIAKARQFSISTYGVWMGLLAALALAGAAAGITVFIQGLGITNLSDQNPWGLWITIDISAIALSAGAFSFCALVYILRLDQFKRLARLAAFVGLCGYSVAMLSLLMDLGRPDRFYFGYLFWNTHSVLWEVTICIGLYFMVMSVENLSNIARFEWLQTRFPRIANFFSKSHDFAPWLAFAGLFLSILHQSSLGNTYGVLVGRPIWFRPGLAVLFFASAVVGGMALTLLVATIAGGLRKDWRIEKAASLQISNLLGRLLLLYLAFRLIDLAVISSFPLPGREAALSLLISGPLSFNFWAGEIIFGIFIPSIILLRKELSSVRIYRLAAFLMVIGGVVAYRWDTNMVGLSVVQSPLSRNIAPQFINYVPSLVEIVSGVGVVAGGLALISLGIRHLRLLEK